MGFFSNPNNGIRNWVEGAGKARSCDRDASLGWRSGEARVPSLDAALPVSSLCGVFRKNLSVADGERSELAV